MATFGQGINPQFGAIDYSPILKGSEAGAQMAAQGSQMIGQGLANLGQEVGKGVAAYYKKQEIKKLENDGVAFIQNLGTKNPYILKAVGIQDPNDTKAIKAGMKAVGGVENFFKLANAAKGEMDKTQAADIVMRYGASGGESSYMGADGETFGSPEANMMARNQYMAQKTQELQQDKLRSEAALNKANAGTKVSLTGFGTLKEAEDSIPADQKKNYTFHFINNRYVALPVSRETELKVGALETTAAAVEAGKTPESALNAVKGTPKTHKVEYVGNKFVAIPFNQTEQLELKLKEGTLNEKETKTLNDNKKYANKVTSELALATVMKDQLNSLATQAANTQPGFWTTLISNIPGTPSADFAAQIDTVISKIGFDRLLQMKDSSPNGSSGLGSLNASELDGLKNSLANLKKSQSYPQFQANLKIVSDYYNNVVKSLQEDKNNLYSSVSSSGSSNVALSPAALKYLQP
jgi:hypothetical protein